MRRRHFLIPLVVALVLGDAGFLAWRWHRDTAPNATITHVGLDSLGVVVRKSAPALTFEKGQWYASGQRIPDPNGYLRSQGEAGRIALVGLSSRSPYDQLVRSIRALKARGICHVMVREGDKPLASNPPYPADGVEIPVLVLCGHQLGDVGSTGTIARDGAVHIDW